MKVLIYLLALLTIVSATSLIHKARRSSRLQWLKHGNKVMIATTLPTIPTGTPNYGYGSTYNPYRTTNWYGGSSSGPWGPTSYPWYGSTNWNGGYTSSNPWNYPTTTSYPWNYPTTTPYPWWGTTASSVTCPYGAITSMSGRQCFKLYTGNLTFIEAERDCQKNNGHLAAIHDAFDNVLLNDYARNIFGTNTQFYIGANDLNNSHDWNWTDGSDFDYSDWYYYQGGGDYQNCAQVGTAHGAWIKVDCYATGPYACSVPPYY